MIFYKQKKMYTIILHLSTVFKNFYLLRNFEQMNRNICRKYSEPIQDFEQNYLTHIWLRYFKSKYEPHQTCQKMARYFEIV